MSLMKALRFVETGAVENARLVQVPRPALRAGEALVRVKAAGVNTSDAAGVAGWLHVTTVPRIPGRDFSGEVVEVSDEAHSKEWIGKEVWGSGGDRGFAKDGTFAEYVSVPIVELSEKPKVLSHVQAASMGLTWVCAWVAVRTLAEVKKGDNVLVIGASGGIGSGAMQLCRERGAKIFGTYRESTKAPSYVTPISLGSGRSIRDIVTELGAFGEIDVLLDCAGYEEPFNDALTCMKGDGTGRVVVMAVHRKDGLFTLNLRLLYMKALILKGLKSSILGPEQVKEMFDYLSARFDAGEFSPPAQVDEVRLEDEAAVHGALNKILNTSPGRRTVFIP